jgi:hypothetical protein
MTSSTYPKLSNLLAIKIPTSLLKEVLPVLAPSLLRLVNLSIYCCVPWWDEAGASDSTVEETQPGPWSIG